MINIPLQIGELTLAHRLIQAPLAGISCAPFRALFSHFRSPAYAATEMISAHSITQSHALKPRYLAHDESEGRWCIQLSGHEPDLMRQAVEVATAQKPDLIDLNCGCPKPKIRGKGCGSALMDDLPQLGQVVAAMRQSTHLPFTVKIRVAGQTQEHHYLDAIKVIEDNGADAIIVHGRHHSEGYDVAANYQQIQQVVQRVTIPVIANGDVSDKVSLERCLAETGADAVMIARGGIGKPWLYQQLLEGTETPSYATRCHYFQLHINQLAELENSALTALLQGRRLLKWYFPELSDNKLSICYQVDNLDKLYDTLLQFEPIGFAVEHAGC